MVIVYLKRRWKIPLLPAFHSAFQSYVLFSREYARKRSVELAIGRLNLIPKTDQASLKYSGCEKSVPQPQLLGEQNMFETISL